ncbi:ribosomal protein S18 acetylase RimI-like enzyme [Microbacterium paludicola]|uniref:Ribosomal protein S18 acetylase RimI-like enzyme n=1 Tax=Microbacterium paludicola TaxID=300019 RepID=A0ABU1I4E2_9MICO|nr:GNAT family N-acetyltransferase [Microbacterium paludicola]MDR6168763.1 ribosomal protein S18 acetylase RimI-like enzyme [Microbacterium paludicola]
MTLTIQPLSSEEELADFECGLESVDVWFRQRAWQARPHVRTHVCHVDGDRIGCFALRLAIVEVTGLSSALRAGANASGQSIALLLAQMGVEKSLQGRGHGRTLLQEAMRAAAAVHAVSPAQLFVVDAENETLISFYESAGLRRIDRTYRLMAPMSRIVKALTV